MARNATTPPSQHVSCSLASWLHHGCGAPSLPAIPVGASDRAALEPRRAQMPPAPSTRHYGSARSVLCCPRSTLPTSTSRVYIRTVPRDTAPRRPRYTLAHCPVSSVVVLFPPSAPFRVHTQEQRRKKHGIETRHQGAR